MDKNEKGDSELSPEELGRIYSEQINAILTEDEPAKFKPVLGPELKAETDIMPLSRLIHRSSVEYYRKIIQEHEHLDVFAQAFFLAQLIAATRAEEIEELEPFVGDIPEERIAEMAANARNAIDDLIYDTKLEVELEEKTGEKSKPLPASPRALTPAEFDMFILSEIEDYERAKRERESALFHAERVRGFLSEDQQEQLLEEAEDMGQ